MSDDFNLQKILRKFVSEDLRVIVTFLVFILFAGTVFAMLMGFVSLGNSAVRTPSVDPDDRVGLADYDEDALPDIIEGTPAQPCKRGDVVTDSNGEYVGRCTESNFQKIDSDSDGFTDAIEDSLGTNPSNWWSPGIVYIIIGFYVVAFIASNYIRGDPLREYKEFEEAQSSGVVGAGGKFAYGGSSVFGKKASEVTEEERKQAIQQDVRFQRMTAEGQQERPKLKVTRNWSATAIQFAIAILLSIFLYLALREAQGL